MTVIQSSPHYQRYEDGANSLPTWWYDELLSQAPPQLNEPFAPLVCPKPTVLDGPQVSLDAPLWHWAHHDALLFGNSTSRAEAQLPPLPFLSVEDLPDSFKTTDVQPQTWSTDAATLPRLSVPATSYKPWEAAAPWPHAFNQWNTKGYDDSRSEIGSQAQTEASLKRRAVRPRPTSFSCELCSKTFTRRKNLTDHMLRHRNRKDFACNFSVCLSRFNTSSDLERHIRVVHKRNLWRYFARDAFKTPTDYSQKTLRAADDSVSDARHVFRQPRRHPTSSRPFTMT